MQQGKTLPTGATILKLVTSQAGNTGKPTAIISTSLQNSGVSNVLTATGMQQQQQTLQQQQVCICFIIFRNLYLQCYVFLNVYQGCTTRRPDLGPEHVISGLWCRLKNTRNLS